MKKNEYETENLSVGEGWSNISTGRIEINGEPRIYYEGNVITTHGIVDTYSESGFTRLAFVWKGRQYIRRWRKQFQPRYLVSLAKQFAKETAS